MWKFLILCVAVFANNVNGEYPNQDWYWFDTIMNLAVGPEDAVHCRLISPSGDVNYDAHGQCRLNILRVSNRHAGVWTMSVVLPDNVLPVEETFLARVYGSASGEPVTTSVEQNESRVELMCLMNWSAPPVTGCLFRDPAGRVLQVRQGLDEDRYSFIQGSNQYRSCGLAIDGPVASDLGLWRCDLETTAGMRYGHLSVNASWVTPTPDPEASNTDPTLTSQTGDQVTVEGDGLIMSCSIQTGIRYCYFTKGNGTVYSVQRGIIYPSMAYVGSGFEAGECGIRFPDLEPADSGDWSCHVGLLDGEERRVEFSIEVQERMSISHGYDNIFNRMVVEANVAGTPTLNYCRFVRRDGLGFTSMNLPDGYGDGGTLGWGTCRLTITSPIIPHDYTWTVAAKVSGLDEELIRHIDIPHDEAPRSRVLWWLWIVIPAILVTIGVVGFFMKRYCCQNSETEVRSA